MALGYDAGVGIAAEAGPEILLLAADGRGSAGATAIAAVGARAVTVSADTLGEHGRAVLMLEIEGADAATLATLLPQVEAAARGGEWPVVVAMDEGAIDAVAAALLDQDVQLLCAPDTVERAAALILAQRRLLPEAPGVRLHESERERLRRVHDEIARIAEALARLTARGPDEAPADAVGDGRPGYDAGPGVDGVDAQLIRAAIRTRRLRDGFFPAGLFEDPAWDMLLDLFAAELEDTRVSVSSLCIAAAVPPTTALRWIGRMTEVGLLRRVPDAQDRRRAFIALTEEARRGLRGYFGAAARAGLPIA